MGFITPALFAIFAATFGALSFKFATLRHLRSFAVAFLLCGIAIFVQISFWPANLDANSLIATALYIAGALLFAEGILIRSDRSMGLTFHAVTFVTLMAATAYYLLVDPNLLVRVYIINFGFGVILLSAAWRNRALMSGTLADKVVFWTFAIVGAHFFPRTIMTAATFADADAGYGATLFWIVMQLSVALLATAGALALLVITGADVFAAMKLERDTDVLTGVLNRRGLESAVDRLAARANGTDAAVIILDLDNFKAINDELGHAAGDMVLKIVAERLVASVRTGDLVARIGGEEFVFLVAGSTRDAAAFAERVRLIIESTPIQGNGLSLNVTASLGVAPYRPNENFWDAMKSADTALYAAKRAGKNVIRVQGISEDGNLLPI